MSVVKQILLSLVLVAAAAAGWLTYSRPDMVGLARESAGPAAPSQGGDSAGRIPGLMRPGGAVNVITAPVELDAGGETIRALGTAKAARSVTLYPEVTGVVAEILFTPGAAVEAGAVLLRLRDAEQQVAVERARVTLDQARQALDRARKLAGSKTIAAATLEEAELAARLAETELKAAEIALERMRVTAPFSGVTGLSDVSVGDLVGNSTPITTLDDLATMRVAFEVPERWAARIASNQPITASPQALPGSEFSGRIAAIDNRVDEATRTLRFEADIPNEGGVLKTGMAVAVALRFDGADELAVPTLSVQWDRNGSYVWKVVDGAAARAAVSIVRRESGVVVVRGELAPGDKVVAEGIQRLRPGTAVVEVDAAAAVAGSAAPDRAAPAPRAEPSGNARAPARS